VKTKKLRNLLGQLVHFFVPRIPFFRSVYPRTMNFKTVNRWNELSIYTVMKSDLPRVFLRAIF